MKYLFSHRNFPAQFRHILFELSKDSSNEIVFITGTKNDINIKGVKKYLYQLKRDVPKNCHRYLKSFEEAVIHGQSAAEVAISLKKQGFYPDVIYAHSWGNSMFLKDVYPNTPQLNYCEWYYNPTGADIGFDGEVLNEDKLALTKCKNAQLLIDLVNCDKGICPTKWQKQQIPSEFHNKIEVLHDGIDTEYFVPDQNAIFKIPNSNITLTANDEVVTYATRGMEPYRGFPQFMKIAEKLLKLRPNLQIVVGGEDRVCYGPKLANTTYKELMLKKCDLDMDRVHFTGGLPYMEYKKLLQISSVHVYLTYPFILSWSLLEAMSSGCCVVTSDTAPVREVIKNNVNGRLVDFYDIDKFVNTINSLLNDSITSQKIKQQARNTILSSYNLKTLLPKHIRILKNLPRYKY